MMLGVQALSEPTSSVPRSVAEILFSPGQRWGWQFRDRRQFRQDIPRPAAADVPRAIVVEAATRRGKEKTSRWWMIGLWVVSFFGSMIASSGLVLILLGLPAAIVTIAWVIRLAKASVAGANLDLARRQAGEVERQWHAAVQAETARVDAITEWGAVKPTASTLRTDVFGGSYRGWRALLTTFGTSMLGSSSPLTVIDLTGAALGYELCGLAHLHGYRIDALQLPEQLDRFDPLAGLDPDEVGDILLETIYGASTAASQHDRLLATRLVYDVCQALSRDLTIQRIREGLLLLLPNADPAKATSLTRAEIAEIDARIPEHSRRASEVRLGVLDAGLHPLQSAGTKPAGRGEPQPPAELTYVNVGDARGRAIQELLVSFVFASTVHRLRRASNSSTVPCLTVVGADSLTREQFERLSALCERYSVALVPIFSRLRGPGADALGGGGAAAFMRLNNAEDAERAAQHIGRSHRFVLAQLTKTVSKNETVCEATTNGGSVASGHSLGFPSLFSFTQTTTTNWGTTNSLSHTSGFAEGDVQQRVYEFNVEPTEIQSLAETALILVQHGGTNGERARLADCNPDIASLSLVSPAAIYLSDPAYDEPIPPRPGFRMPQQLVIAPPEHDTPRATRPEVESPKPQPANPASAPTDKWDELRKLARLREDGILTEEEFLEQKTVILRGPALAGAHDVPPIAADESSEFESRGDPAP